LPSESKNSGPFSIAPAHGLQRQHRRRPAKPDAAVTNDAPDVYARETRSYEHPYVHGLWHLDFHEGSRKVLVPSGEWKSVVLLGALDDCSRLCCHAQWHFHETTESLVHALWAGFKALRQR
jgi:putative transposase